MTQPYLASDSETIAETELHGRPAGYGYRLVKIVIVIMMLINAKVVSKLFVLFINVYCDQAVFLQLCRLWPQELRCIKDWDLQLLLNLQIISPAHTVAMVPPTRSLLQRTTPFSFCSNSASLEK